MTLQQIKLEKFLREEIEPYASKISRIVDGDEVIMFPFIDNNAFIHSTACLIGGIYVSKGVFIGPYAVIRLDEEGSLNGLFIDENTNIQDHVLIHSYNNKLGRDINLAHGVVVHGSQIDDGSTLYIKVTVDHAKIGKSCFIDAHSYIRNVTIPDNCYVPPGSIIVSNEDLKLVKPMTEEFKKLHEKVNKQNRDHRESYSKSEIV